MLSRNGKPMSDGLPTPGALDGMAAFALPNGNIRLIRNHENRDMPANSKVKGDAAMAYDARGGGGCTSLEVRVAPDGTSEVVRDFMSLNGTIVNCAGDPTPWGSWLACEESVEGRYDGWAYIFEVPASAEGLVEPVPLEAMGRFVHEALAVDPETGIVYETEDRQIAGFYRFIPTTPARLVEGGSLQVLAVEGRPNLDTADGMRVGAAMPVVRGRSSTSRRTRSTPPSSPAPASAPTGGSSSSTSWAPPATPERPRVPRWPSAGRGSGGRPE